MWKIHIVGFLLALHILAAHSFQHSSRSWRGSHQVYMQSTKSRPSVKVGPKISTINPPLSTKTPESPSRVLYDNLFSTSNTKKPTNLAVVSKPTTNGQFWLDAPAFNSTTLKTLVQLSVSRNSHITYPLTIPDASNQTNVTSSFLKLEKNLVSLLSIIVSKIERDLRTTASVTEYLRQRTAKDTGKLFKGLDNGLVKYA